MVRSFISYGLIAICIFSSPYIYPSESSDISNDEIRLTATLYLKQKRYEELGQLLSKNIKQSSDLDNLYGLAIDLKDEKLRNAIIATRNISGQDNIAEISIGELLQLSLFIESKIKNRKQNDKFYYDLSLPRPIEVDPENGNIIIYLEDKSSCKVGRGWLKKFNISILYNVDTPLVITTGFLNVPKKNSELRERLLREANITKKLNGEPGIVKSYSILMHPNISETEDEIVFAEKLYIAGSIGNITLNKTYTFTLSEQIKLATDYMNGLSSMYRNGVIHHDLYNENYLVDVYTKDDKRGVVGAITDFGRARYAKGDNIFRKQSKRDIFKIGIALYGLFHNKYIFRLDEAKEAFNPDVLIRRETLREKMSSSLLSLKERYEYLLLNMIQPDEDKRGTIEKILEELKAIKT